MSQVVLLQLETDESDTIRVVICPKADVDEDFGVELHSSFTATQILLDNGWQHLSTVVDEYVPEVLVGGRKWVAGRQILRFMKVISTEEDV